MSDEIKKKKGLKEFSLSSLAVDNGTSVFIITLMIMLFGIQAYENMPKEQFPEVDWPTVYINTPYFGNSAVDIENLVTRPIEKELQSITGVKDIKSTSIQDYSVITAEFNADMDLDDATRKVKDAVDKAKSELPTDLDSDPAVLDINLSEIPIVTINISGDYNNDELRNFAEYLEDEIEKLDEISNVELRGALEREVKVDVNLMKMESMKVSFGDLENAIATENITMSGGELLNDGFRRAIRVKGEFENVQEIEEMIVKSENQRPIYLKDFAEVTFGYQDPTSIARSDGLPVISLDVVKRQGENLLEASDKIKVIVDDARKVLPADLKISLFNDQSVNTRTEVNNLENSIISGVILVVLVLLFFLGLRNALFVGLAIPLSMLTGIMFLSLTGVTMNIVVLFSLILALGLLVDNAIVVVENIYRYRQEGYSGWESAKYGAGEVAVPIIASTATTLAAFLPLAFWPGIMGEFMKYMPITLIIVLTSSLLVALVINPVFTSRFMNVDERADQLAVRRRRRNSVLISSAVMLLLAVLFHFTGAYPLRNFLGIATGVILANWFILRPASFYFQNRLLPLLEAAYDKFIRAALRFPGTVFASTFVLLFLAIALLAVKSPKVIFFPSADPIYVNVFVELPLGKDIEVTNELMRSLEKRVESAIRPYTSIVEAVLTQIGENTSDPNGPPEPGASPHKARLTVSFVPANERHGISTFEVMEKIRDSVRGIPGVNITVDKNADGPSAGKPINLEVQGEDMDQLALLSEDLIRFFNSKNIPGIEELQADVKIGKPEVIVNVDREAARRYEISTYDIANAIRTSVFGKEVSKFKEGEDEYPIFVRLDERYRNDINGLLNQKVTFRSPASGQLVQVPISTVANVSFTSTYSAVKRKNMDRVITIYSNVLEGYNANEIIQEMKGWMEQYPLPAGYAYEFTGEQQQQAEDMSFLNLAFGIAIFSIFLIIVAQFNSVSSPFIIILSVLFSTIGVFLGYAFSGRDISVIFTGVGIISLAGVVVNNAIVLIDYTNLVIKRRKEELGLGYGQELSFDEMKEAIVKGGATRLRPVLLTAITTVLGLVPLAVGFNFNFFTLVSSLDPQIFIGGDNTAVWGPMAWTVIYGLVFATFLTLIVVPAMYWLSFRFKLWALGLLRGRGANA
ncbi:MAG: efflux RND transporter permease subunit [Phaeodactylibacter sp.]|nr:efflux RND transporter permease subunit [Phaeodactylibacter sp.]MCB9275397.1 efflux RND transporter permease subunit [Lewinellaceae bacterium]